MSSNVIKEAGVMDASLLTKRFLACLDDFG